MVGACEGCEAGRLGDFSAWLAAHYEVPAIDTGRGIVSLICDCPVVLVHGCFSWVWEDLS